MKNLFGGWLNTREKKKFHWEKSEKQKKPKEQKQPNREHHNYPQHRITKNPRRLIGFDEDRAFYSGQKQKEEARLRIMCAGGVNEVGENCMIVEYGQNMLLIDMGIAFPGQEACGVNYYVPDLDHVHKNLKNLKGIIITHGHLDHIGAIPYVIEKLNFPTIYASKLTTGLIKERLIEFKLDKQVKIVTFNPSETLIFGEMKVGFYRVAHSIPDALGVYIKTPTGSMVHSGDFKFCDDTSDGIPQDLEKMRKLGEKGIDILFSDSTNALNPGRTIPDKEVAFNLNKIISEAKNRVIVATFSSQLGRMQELLNCALKNHRYVFTSGRSIETNLKVAKNLEFIKYPEKLLLSSKEAKNIAAEKTLIICTGSQGEREAAIQRMISGEHPYFKINKTDTVIFSSSPIPGNETAVHQMIDNLSRLGANIIHNKIIPVHSSGHAYVDECKELIRLIKPKHFTPIHGTHFMRSAHKKLAMEEGIAEKNTFLIDNGDILEVHNGHVKKLNERILARHVIVDGNSVGVDGSSIIDERKTMGSCGALIINLKTRNNKLDKNTFMTSRGLFYENEPELYYPKINEFIEKTYNEFIKTNPKANIKGSKDFLSRKISSFIEKILDRKPLVIIVIDVLSHR